MKFRKYKGLLLVGFATLILSIILISVTGLVSLTKTNKLFEQTYTNSFKEWVETEQANANLIALHKAMNDVALSRNTDQLDAALKDVSKYDVLINEYFMNLKGIEEDNILLNDVITAYKDWEPIRAKTIDFTKKGEYDLASENTKNLEKEQVDFIIAAMHKLIDAEKKEAEEAFQLSKNTSSTAVSRLLWLSLYLLLSTGAISIFINNKLRRAEEELQEEKEQLRITFEAIGDGIITTDINKNVLRLNKVAEEMTGWTTEDAFGKPFLEVFSITNAITGNKAKDPVEQVLETDQICELENHTVLKSKDGKDYHIADSAAPIKDIHNNTIGVVMVFRDVTEKKEFEKKLRASEEHYRMLFNSMLNGYALHEMIYDENGVPCDYKFVDINPAFEKMTGLTKDSCIGKSIKEILPETEEKWITTYGNVVLTGKTVKYEDFSGALGKYFEVYAFRPIENHFAVVCDDITKRKQLEHLVIEEKEQLRITFESIGDGIITTNIDKEVLKLNKVAEEMTGWTTADALGKPFLEVFHIINSTTGKKAKDPVEEVLLTGKICELANHTVLIAKDGTRRHIADSAAPIKDLNGNITGIVMVFRDVTEKIKSSDELEKREFVLRESQKVAHIGSYVIDDINNKWISSVELDRIFGIDESYDRSLDSIIDIVHPDWKEKVASYVASVYSERKRFDYQYKIVRINDGSERWVHEIGELGYDKDGNIINMIGTIQDITEQKKAADEIEYISYHDALTRICNRRKFEMSLDSIGKSGVYPVSIIIGDVNGLKLVNDAFGHINGDNILVRIAQIMNEECFGDTCVARIGGDEFAALLIGVSYDEASLMTKRIKDRCLAETTKELMLNISFGISTKENENDDLQKCYYLAEERMYAGKLLETKSTRSAIIANLRAVMEEKTGETQRHCERIAEMAQKMGEMLGMQSFEIEYLKLLALLHDIGKTGVSESILLKPDKLNEEEWKIMERHCEIGFRIANTMPELVPIADGILSHHERWDGSGYPHNLKQDEIPLMARIVSVLDTYDAMTNDRPYRKALSVNEAIEEIVRCSGTQFDPTIVNVFIEKVLDEACEAFS